MNTGGNLQENTWKNTLTLLLKITIHQIEFGVLPGDMEVIQNKLLLPGTGWYPPFATIKCPTGMFMTPLQAAPFRQFLKNRLPIMEGQRNFLTLRKDYGKTKKVLILNSPFFHPE